MRSFREMSLVESSTKSMTYKSTEGDIEITYEVRKEKVYFSFKNKEGEVVDLITSTYKKQTAENAIFNWLKSIDY